MENGKENNPQFDSFIIFAQLYKQKFFIIGFVLIITVASVIYSLQMPNWFSSTISAVPPKNNQSMMQGALGNISSALRNFGLTKLGGSESGVYSFMVILESRTIKDSIIRKYDLQKRYEMEDARFSEVRTTFEDNFEAAYETDGNFTITIWDTDPDTAVMMVEDYYAIVNNYASDLSKKEAEKNREYMEQRFELTEQTIDSLSIRLKDYSKKYLIFAPEQQAQSITEALSEMKAELIKQEIVYDLTKSRYGEEDPYSQMQKRIVEELKSKVSETQNKPGFAGNFSLAGSAEIGMNFLKLYADIEALTKVKSIILPMLEEARLDEIRQTQSLYIVDKPVKADKKSKPKRSFIVAGSFVGALVLAVLFILLHNGIKLFLKKYKEFIASV